MKDALDFLGKPLAIGDHIVFMQVGYRGLMVGEIIMVSPKKG